MIDPRPAPPLPRPAPAAEPGPLDGELYDLVEARFLRLIRDNPVLGTAVGLHQDDDLLGDGSREAVLAELAAERDHLARVEALDPAGLSPEAAFERDLETHNVRRAIFDTDVLRIWERRSFALDLLGDSLFLLFARDHAALPERLDSIAGRLEATATYLEEAKTRATVPQVRRWQQIEIETAGELPIFFDELVAAGVGVLAAPEQRRLERASESAKLAIELYGSWLEGTLADGTDEWAIGRERHDAMVGLRAFDGLDADAILELGWERLNEEHAARAAAAREIDADADETDVIERVKSDQPADFEAALDAYRDAMQRARQPPDRARPDDHPRRRADRHRRDPAVPAQRRPVRGLLRAGRLRSRSEGHLHRDPVGRRRPERDARAQLRLDQQHQHPRGLPRPSPPARHRASEPLADPPADRRPRIRRGLGHVLGADDARARLR